MKIKTARTQDIELCNPGQNSDMDETEKQSDRNGYKPNGMTCE